MPLPGGVACFALAATLATKREARKLVGDGLVALDSALGRHEDPRLELAFPAKHRHVVEGIGHLDLLGHPDVYRRIRRWLDAAR